MTDSASHPAGDGGPRTSPHITFVLGTTAAAGAENQCRYLLSGLHGRGVRVNLVCFRRGEAHQRFEELGIPIHVVDARLPLTLDWYRRAHRLRRLFAQAPPDILHTWLNEAHVVGLAAARSWPATKVVLGQRHSGVVRRDRQDIVALRGLRTRIDHVVANSEAGAQTIAARVGIDQHRLSVISNGIPPGRVSVARGREAVREALGIALDAPVVCSVGRIDHEGAKDYPTLFAAMRRVWSELPDAAVIIVGPTAAQVEQTLGTKLPPRVHVLGWQPHPADWINAADVFAVHSRTEGYSNVAGEALMLGLPVATTDVGGHPPLVRRTGGRVAPPARGDLLGQAIVDLIHDPPPRAEAIRVAHEALSMKGVVSAYLRIYERLLAGADPVHDVEQRTGSAVSP